MNAHTQPSDAEAEGPGSDADVREDEHETRAVEIDATWHGRRLDHALVALAPEFSRSHLQGLVERGHVRLDGAVVAACSRKLRLGQHLHLTLVPTAQSQAFRPEPLDLQIIHEDPDLLVLDKPAGLVVHPAAGHWSGTLLNGLLAHHAGAAALPRAGIVHRLDKDTSGLMVVAKTLRAMTGLVRAIAAREVGRHYLALAHGVLAANPQTIDAPIGRDPVSRLRMAVVASGKPARTDIVRVAVKQGISAIHCRLHTGRTHQIRVHLAYTGHPLVADAVYGGPPALGLKRQALHATQLAFEHPVRGHALCFDRAPPADLASAWAAVVAH